MGNVEYVLCLRMSSGFSEQAMRERLQKLTPQQESIQTLSLWLLHHQRHHADMIVSVWLKEIKRETNSPRLVNLVYLANDVIQNARKKAPELMTKFYGVLEPAFRHCSKVSGPDLDRALTKVLKVFTDRQIYLPDQVAKLESALRGKKSKSSNGASTSANDPILGLSEPLAPKPQPPVSKAAEYDPEAVSRTCEDALQSLRQLDDPPSTNAEIRQKLASYPESVGNPNMLVHIRNGDEVEELLEQINEVEPISRDYCKKLADEMLDRRNLQKLLDSMLVNVRATVEHQDTLLREVKRKEEKVKADLTEVQRALQSLPDLSDMPVDTPLPSLEKLFDL